VIVTPTHQGGLSANRLLAGLPRGVRERLQSTIKIVPLKLKEVLHRPGETIREVFFPGGGFCSIVTVLGDGAMVEVATIGREGMVGIPGALGNTASPTLTMVQGESELCYRLPVHAFQAELDRREVFADLMLRYSEAHMGTVMQATACNAVHSVEQRLARWLLLASDRMEASSFPLTQDFVAMMLGASRPTVTIVAGTLQKAGLLTYHRGQVTILNREQLELVSCECYRRIVELLGRV
jgi:CRP-like cAMP-binding protein